MVPRGGGGWACVVARRGDERALSPLVAGAWCQGGPDMQFFCSFTRYLTACKCLKSLVMLVRSFRAAVGRLSAL